MICARQCDPVGCVCVKITPVDYAPVRINLASYCRVIGRDTIL
jgi:hypothetical protein